jgi:hypothetical protein
MDSPIQGSQTSSLPSASCVGIHKHFVGAIIHGFYVQTGSLAQLRHFSAEIEFTEFLSTNLNSWNWVNVMLLRIEPGSVKYQFARLTTKPTVKLPSKSQTSFKMLYNTSLNSPSPQIPGFQNTGIWHLFKNSNSALLLDSPSQGSHFSPLESSSVIYRWSTLRDFYFTLPPSLKGPALQNR